MQRDAFDQFHGHPPSHHGRRVGCLQSSPGVVVSMARGFDTARL
jgi:hypothetical protein